MQEAQEKKPKSKKQQRGIIIYLSQEEVTKSKIMFASTMRTLLTWNLLCAVPAAAFLPAKRVSRVAQSNLVVMQESTSAVVSDFTSDFGSAMPEEVSPYDRIGIKEEQLALGINPEDIVKYIGTREDILDRVKADIPSLDQAQAEAEVDKFLLDAECLKVYIEFSRRKAEDPDFALETREQQEEGFFSFRTVVFLYIAYVAYDAVPTMFRRWVEGKQEAGEWNGSGIQFIDDWLANAPVDVPAAVDAAVDATVNAAADVAEAADKVGAAVDFADVTEKASTMLQSLVDFSSTSLS